jgi:16S rRNA A1518/A1519 N6-dimethyltransferase RsmA/KsgA/DIM1 with predicted DNA glycosylase/AP lyase activity
VRFAAFVRALFQQRRKTLRTTLFRAAAAVGGAVPAHAGDLGARAERLGPQEVVSWFMRCSASQPHESNPR